MRIYVKKIIMPATTKMTPIVSDAVLDCGVVAVVKGVVVVVKMVSSLTRTSVNALRGISIPTLFPK